MFLVQLRCPNYKTILHGQPTLMLGEHFAECGHWFSFATLYACSMHERSCSTKVNFVRKNILKLLGSNEVDLFIKIDPVARQGFHGEIPTPLIDLRVCVHHE